jgi:hypothetical protein
MIRNAKGDIDIDRYVATSKAAIEEVAAVLKVASGSSPHIPGTLGVMDSGYTQFINLKTELPPFLFGAHPIKKLVKEMAKGLGYQVRFTSLSGDKLALLHNFVSWLWVNEKDKILEIVYNSEVIKSFVGIDGKDDKATRSWFWADLILSKVCLHEYAHASRHLGVFLERIKKGEGDKPSVDSEHEPDAWLYAETVWGILIGDHAYLKHSMPDGADESWRLP